MCNSACQDALFFNTRAHTQVDISTYRHADAQISLKQCAALQLLRHKQMGSTV